VLLFLQVIINELPGSAILALTQAVRYILSIRANTTFCCSRLSRDHRSRSFLCSLVNDTGSFPSENNCDSVIPKAVQIFSKEGTVGTMFFRYHDEIVDCGKPECSES